MSFINRKQKMRKMPEPVQTGTTPSDRQPATETVPNEPEAPVIHQRKSRRAVNRQSATPADIANSVRESLLKRKLLKGSNDAGKHDENRQSPFSVFDNHTEEDSDPSALPEDIASAFELSVDDSETLPSDLADGSTSTITAQGEDEEQDSRRHRFFLGISSDEEFPETQCDLNSINNDEYNTAENAGDGMESNYDSGIAGKETDDLQQDMPEVWENHAETGQSQTPAKEAGSQNVLGRLAEITRGYNACRQTDKDKFQIIYYEDSVKAAKVSDGIISLSNNKVYVDGRLSEWDDCFEIKVKAGSQVEIETGIGFSIPEGCRLEVCCSRKQAEKYYFKPSSILLDSRDAIEPLVVSLSALEGAYLSKIGRIIECQIVES